MTGSELGLAIVELYVVGMALGCYLLGRKR